MYSPKELNALLSLIEDPDEDVFAVVSNRIMSFGPTVIPSLEHLWEHSVNNDVLERVEQLIHRLHFNSLLHDFKAWADAAHQELLPGTLLVAKLLYPHLHVAKVIQDVERLRRNVWLELNNYLTPLEQVTVFNNIFYNYFGLRGDYNNYDKPAEFLIHKIIEAKRGNQTGNGVLYLILAELLDMPIRLLPIPGQFILGWLKSQAVKDQAKLHLNIEFFIDPVTGQPFSHTDLTHYFLRTATSVAPAYFMPCNHKQVIVQLLQELAKCYTNKSNVYIAHGISDIVSLLQ